MADFVRMFEETLKAIDVGSYIACGKTVALPFSKAAVEDAEYFDAEQVHGLIDNLPYIAPFHDGPCAVDITNNDTLDAVKDFRGKGGKGFSPLRRPMLVLNFANPHFPGGGVANGARAQEEELCRRTTLYASISSRAACGFYEANKLSGDYIFTDGVILSPNVTVIRGRDGRLLESPFNVSVLTCPAPFVKRISSISDEDLHDVLRNRILGMLHVAAARGYDKLVLGAWGCGAFGNEPSMVAAAFYDALSEMHGKSHDGVSAGPRYQDMFSQIVFAVLDRSSDKRNYSAFLAMTERIGLEMMEERNLERFLSVNEAVGEANDLKPKAGITVFGAISVGDLVGIKHSKQVIEVTHVGYELLAPDDRFEFAGTDIETGRKQCLFNRRSIDWVERRQ